MNTPTPAPQLTIAEQIKRHQAQQRAVWNRKCACEAAYHKMKKSERNRIKDHLLAGKDWKKLCETPAFQNPLNPEPKKLDREKFIQVTAVILHLKPAERMKMAKAAIETGMADELELIKRNTESQ